MDSLTLTESCADMILWAKGDHGHPPNRCCFAVGQHPSPSNLVLLYVQHTAKWAYCVILLMIGNTVGTLILT